MRSNREDSKNFEETKSEDTPTTSTETQREKLIRITKNNSNRLLHERNKYVFLASVAEDTMS